MDVVNEARKQEGLDRISAAMGRFRVLIGRRVIGRLALANVAPSLDISDLDALTLVPAQPGRDDPRHVEGEVSVGDIARQLRVDPSRASRLVAGLVEQGYLIRAVSQEDARRAVLQRTEAGDRIFSEIRRVKLDMIAEILAEWPEERVTAFAEGFEAFTLALEGRMTTAQGQPEPAAADAKAARG